MFAGMLPPIIYSEISVSLVELPLPWIVNTSCGKRVDSLICPSFWHSRGVIPVMKPSAIAAVDDVIIFCFLLESVWSLNHYIAVHQNHVRNWLLDLVHNSFLFEGSSFPTPTITITITMQHSHKTIDTQAPQPLTLCHWPLLLPLPWCPPWWATWVLMLLICLCCTV